MAVSGSSIAELGNVFANEYDDFTRDCEVSLFLSHLSDYVKSVVDWDYVKHWALLFEFDNRSVVYEMTNPEGRKTSGKITPRWYHFDGSGLRSHLFDKYVKLGSVNTSPKVINGFARKHPMNGTEYHAKDNNCQEWAKFLLNQIDPKLWEAANRNGIKTFKEEHESGCSGAKIANCKYKADEEKVILHTYFFLF